MINNKIIYSYNDMSLAFYLLNKGFYINVEYGTIDFLSNFLSTFFLVNFGFILASNLLALLFIIINFGFSYKLFFYIIEEKKLSIIFSLIFSLSVYYLYRVQSFTPNLYPTFIFPLIVYMLYKKSKPFNVGLILGFFSIFSSYYMYFAGVIAVIWYLFFRKYKELLVYFVTFILFVIIFNFQTILINVPIFEKLESSIQVENSQKVVRPIEDWYNFSIKPWYFIIPPNNSLFFSDLSYYVHEKISSTEYFLTQNYVEDEMAGVFLGWHFIVGLVFVALYFFYKPLNKKISIHFENLNKHKKLIFFSFYGIFTITLISAPPSFTISGIEIFTPSYILFHIVPFFRALARWGIVIFLLTLIVNIILFYDLSRFFKKQIHKSLFLILFVTLNFLMFSIKLNIIDTASLPKEIVEINKISKKSYISLPTGYYSIFWGSMITPHLQSLTKASTTDLKILNSYSHSIFLEDSEIFSEIDAVIVYKDKITQSDLASMNKLNSKIQNIEDIYTYLENAFGEKTYFDANTVIFRKL